MQKFSVDAGGSKGSTAPTEKTRPLIWTPELIAKRWRCDAKTVRTMLNNGTLKGFRVGQKLWRVRVEHLDEYELGIR